MMSVEYKIGGLPREVDTDELEDFIEQVLAGAKCVESTYYLSSNKRTVALIRVETNLPIHVGARLLRQSKWKGTNLHVELNHNVDTPTSKNTEKKREWDVANTISRPFYQYIKEDSDRLERAADRDEAGVLFHEYCASNDIAFSSRLESLVFQVMREQDLMRTKRYGNKVVVMFAQEEPSDFTPEEDARDRVLQNMKVQQENKHGVTVSEAKGLPNVVPIKGVVTFEFHINSEDPEVALQEVSVFGPQKSAFAVVDSIWPKNISDDDKVQVVFASTSIGLYRGAIRMRFTKEAESFIIVRYLKVKSADEAIDDILKPTAPYEKRKRRFQRPSKHVVPPPKAPKKSGSPNPFKKLPKHYIPGEIQQLLVDRKLEDELEQKRPDKNVDLYANFWKNLLWVSEYQAYKDIQLYDMERVELKREGRFMVLHVPGLAEGRPSVLRGDLVNVTWKDQLYKGSVYQTRLLEVLMELDDSIHRRFNQSLDTVDVRFTFSRTTFRTSHEGCSKAVTFLGERMLAPKSNHEIPAFNRSVPMSLKWANRSLNDEQRAAVFQIVKGGRRPLPYILFGPPGTGKTTTVVETVYQLNRNDEYLNILLVAPSNDAADILVEKLSSYFPPSEMRRIIAYSRSIDQVSPTVRPFVTEGLADGEMCIEIMASRIVVSTVNLAARFIYYGVPRGHFGVLCVDEAGHATEPEVIGVAASLMDFKRQDSQVGQLILAGDPRQLGPVITSDLCQKFGMSVSYMERLTDTKVYSRDEDDEYSPELITKLVRTYRSHPAILKLPNEMYYDSELQACGDVVSTHSLSKWEHLPQPGFPVIFHAVNGENLREGTSPSWFNKEEAQEVVNYVDLLVNQSKPAVQSEDIGIITPYARQAQKIRQLLKYRSFPETIKVGSVETFQGQERRVIIISTVRAESDLLDMDRKFNLGFVCNEKRFNVAVTRAKSLLIVVGSPSVLATDKKSWLPFLRYCKEHNSWTGQPWVEDEDESDLYESKNSSRQDDEDWLVLDGFSPAVAQEGLGFVNREE